MTLNAEVIPQKDWLARSNLEFFRRNENAVMAEHVVLISHETVLRALSRTYEVVSRDAHYITIAARSILAERVSGRIYQEEELFKAEMAINDHMDKIGAYFDQRIQQAEQRLRAAGYDPGKVPHRGRLYGAKASTRTATDFLEVVKKADLYLVLHQYLWITGELSDSSTEALKAKLNNEREVRSHLLSVPRKTTAHFQIVRRICAGVTEQRRQERAAQSVRDKARAMVAKNAKKGAVATPMLATDVEPMVATLEPVVEAAAPFAIAGTVAAPMVTAAVANS